jgi:hypothetical protein
MAANDQPVRASNFSRWMRGMLAALLLASVCGFNLFMNPWGMAVETGSVNEYVALFLYTACMGAAFVQPAVLAVWMAFANKTPNVRITIGLAVLLLICTTLALGIYAVEGRVNNEVVGFPLLFPIQTAVIFPFLAGVRRLTRWRLAVPVGDANVQAASGQFGVRSLMIWTFEVGLLVGLLSFLFRQLPDEQARNSSPMDGMPAMVVGTLLFSLPAIAAAWMVLGRWRAAMIGAMLTVVGVSLAGGVSYAVIYLSNDNSMMDGVFEQIVSALTGMVVAATFVYFVLRALGYRMIRVEKAVPTTDAIAAEANAPRELLSRYKLRWQFVAAMLMVLAACGSIGWRATQVVPQRLKNAEDQRLKDRGIDLMRSTSTDSAGTHESIAVITIKAGTVVDASLLDEIKKLDPAPPLQLQNPKPKQQLEQLCKLTDARSLLVYQSELDDADLAMVANSMTKLDTLNISNTKVTPAGFAELAKLPNLVSLVASNLPITDESLVHLYGLKSLMSLEIKSTKVTADGVQKLRAALPQANIQWQ